MGLKPVPVDPEIDDHCFVCGPANAGGLQARFTAADGSATGTATLRDLHQGYRNTPHGGILSALLDEAMVYAAASLGRWVATAELQIRFRHAPAIGDELTVSAQVTARRGRVITASATLEGPEGKTLATASGRLLQLREITPDELEQIRLKSESRNQCD